MGEKEGKPEEKGKGGNFDTRRNPFMGRQVVKGSAPELGAVIGLGLILDKVLRGGNAVMLGHTRDGGALVITILDGDLRHKGYNTSEEELDAAFKALAEMYAE
jgi:hypothetical protein